MVYFFNKQKGYSVLLLIAYTLVLAGCISVKVSDEQTVKRPEQLLKETRALSRAEKILNAFNKPDSKIVLVAAHRGDWRNFPENSLEAIESAIGLGVDIVEIDIQQTKDGALVLMHDKTVDRTTTGKGQVAELTLMEIKKLKLKNGIGRSTDYMIPTLQEALAIAKDRVLINLDKCYEFRNAAIPIIRSLDMVDQVIIKGSAGASQVRSDFGEQFDSLIYMPVLHLDKSNAKFALENYINELRPAAIEMVFSSDTSQVLAAMSTTQKLPYRIWVNSLWKELSAGHTDDNSVASPDENYGWLLGKGVSIIQTDRIELLLRYLKKKKRRSKW